MRETIVFPSKLEEGGNFNISPEPKKRKGQ
jgi:hypothetical protein